MEYDECSVQLLFYTLLVGLLVKCMLRLACVLLYQGRFKSRRSGGSRISLRVRSILVTFCMYFCSSYIIFILYISVVRNALFLFHFQFSSVCILAICLCMHVCLCAVYRTAASISKMCRYKNLRATFFVLQYVTINFRILRIHTNMYRADFCMWRWCWWWYCC